MALEKLKTGFGAAALVTMMTVTPAAYAQDTQPVSQTQEQLICVDVGEYQCATPEVAAITTSELALGIMSKDRVVIHFGRGIANAGTTAAVMTDHGVPTLAVPGYENDGEAMFYLDGRKMTGWPTTTQETIDRMPFAAPLSEYFEKKRAQQAALIDHDNEDRPALAALTAEAG